MRKLVLLAPRSDLEDFEGLPDLTIIESFRVVHQLRFTSNSMAGICEVKFRSPKVIPELMVGHAGLEKVETLARRDDGGFVAYFEGTPTTGWARLATATGAHLLPPFELTPKDWRIAVVGTGSQLRAFLTELRRSKIHYRVQTISDSTLRTRTPLGNLTPRQREVLIAAYRIGYYDVPRRADLDHLAESLHLGKSTTGEHLRKAEKRLLDHAMSE